MSEITTESNEAPAQEPEGQGVDWKAEARKWEQRAKDANKRVKELEPFEVKARELEDSSNAELQRAQERADAAERALADATIAATRAEIAAEKGVPIALLTGDTREALTASADALVNFRNETARQGNYVPSEGRNSNIDKGGDTLAYVNSLWDRAQAN